MSRAGLRRLSVVDEIFLRSHRGMGTPVVLQGLWRTADRVDPALLRAVHAELGAGPLGRRVIRPRVPGARRGWVPTTRTHPLELLELPVPRAALLDWADAQGGDLDPEFGPGWRLSAARLDDGGTAVSLTCSHALADARGLICAVDDALRSIAAPAEPSAPRPGTNSLDTASDWADAWHQWSIVLRGTARALRRGIPAGPPASARDGSAPDGTFTPHGAVLQCPAAEWDRVAAAHDGSANSLFVWTTAHMLWSSGFPRDTLTVSLPVDTRAEPRVDNDLAVTEITIDRADTPATIRRRCRAAYEHRMSSPGGMPEELLQVVPDRWAHALSRGAGERDILCSNIGTLPDRLRTLGPHRCTGVAARAIHPGLTADRLPRTRLSSYLCRIGDTYVLSLVSLDPTHLESPGALRELAHSTLSALSLPITLW